MLVDNAMKTKQKKYDIQKNEIDLRMKKRKQYMKTPSVCNCVDYSFLAPGRE